VPAGPGPAVFVRTAPGAGGIQHTSASATGFVQGGKQHHAAEANPVPSSTLMPSAPQGDSARRRLLSLPSTTRRSATIVDKQTEDDRSRWSSRCPRRDARGRSWWPRRCDRGFDALPTRRARAGNVWTTLTGSLPIRVVPNHGCVQDGARDCAACSAAAARSGSFDGGAREGRDDRLLGCAPSAYSETRVARTFSARAIRRDSPTPRRPPRRRRAPPSVPAAVADEACCRSPEALASA